MTLAYDYPLLSVLVSMLWFFILIAWIMTVFHVFVDIFRSKDLGGFSKAIWSLFVLFLPFLGVLVYLIVRGDDMRDHAIADAQARDAAMREYVQDAAAGAGTADELTKLASLRDAGTLTPAEFDAAKAKVLAG